MYVINSTTWNKVNEHWWQKILISKNGNQIITYHYKFKSAESAIVFELNTSIAKRLNAYHLIEKDLRDSIEFLDLYLESCHDKGHSFNVFLTKALVRAIVVTYGKCFAKAEGRGTKLERSNVPMEYQIMHDFIIEMRNQYVAHAGKSQHEKCKLVCVIPPQKKIKKVERIDSFCELSQSVSLEIFNTDAKFLFESLNKFTQDQIKKIEEAMKEEVISTSKLYKFSKNKGRRIMVNQEDIDKFTVDD